MDTQFQFTLKPKNLKFWIRLNFISVINSIIKEVLQLSSVGTLKSQEMISIGNDNSNSFSQNIISKTDRAGSCAAELMLRPSDEKYTEREILIIIYLQRP